MVEKDNFIDLKFLTFGLIRVVNNTRNPSYGEKN